MPGVTTRSVLRRSLARRTRSAPRGAADAPAASIEALEARALLTFSWTPQEVYLAELVNRARANPAAEGARLGIDLSAGLTLAEAARLVPQEPLALNQYLTQAARSHSQDMAARNFFDHINPDGLDPTARAHAAGYGGTAGENIAAGYSTLDAVHRAWMESVGHRKNILSLYSNFDASFHYDELGVGIALNAGGAYNNYFTETFGYQGATPAIYLLGVAFADNDGDNFYSVGEGMANVRIDAALQSAPGVVVGTYTTDAAGNYQIALPAGSYQVTFTRLSDGFRVTKSATIAAQNVKVDAKASELAAPPSSDDYANAGQWGSAGLIVLDPATGNSATAGLFETGGDTDLFRFVATRTGQARITLTHPAGLFAVQLAAYGSSQNLLATGTPGGEFGNGSVVNLQVVSGQTYYLLAGAVQSGSVGSYVVLIQGPAASGTPQDDFANIGDLAHAGTILLDPATGSGAKVGYLEYEGDTDLFRIDAPRTGSTTVTLSQPLASFALRLHLYSASGQELQVGVASGDAGTASVITFNAVEGTSYYLGVEPVVSTSRGLYTFNIEGPGPVPPPPAPVVVNEAVQPTYQSLVNTLYIGGRLTLVFTNQWNQPLIAQRSDTGGWVWADIRGASSLPEVDGEMVAWTDPRENINYASIRGLTGLLLFREDTPGHWSYRNLTSEIDLSLSISADLEVFLDPMNRATIAGITDGGDLVTYNQTLRRNAGGQYVWTFRNITALDVEPRGLTMPYVTSELVSWVTPAKSCNIAFINGNGSVELFYRPRGQTRWSMQDLGQVAPTAPLVGELTVFQNPSTKGVTIGGTDEFGHLWVTQFRSGAGWSSRDLTQKTRGPAFNIRSLGSYVTASGLSYVAGIRSDGTVALYRFNPARNAWVKLVGVNLDPPDFRNMAGRLSAAVAASGQIDIIGTLDSQRLVRWTLNGSTWTFEDVSYSMAANGPG